MRSVPWSRPHVRGVDVDMPARYVVGILAGGGDRADERVDQVAKARAICWTTLRAGSAPRFLLILVIETSHPLTAILEVRSMSKWA